MDVIGTITAVMLGKIIVIVEFIKKVFPKMKDFTKIMVSLMVGGAIGYSMFVSEVITNIYVAIGIGVIAGGEAAGLWKIVHGVLDVIREYTAAAINKKSIDNP